MGKIFKDKVFSLYSSLKIKIWEELKLNKYTSLIEKLHKVLNKFKDCMFKI